MLYHAVLLLSQLPKDAISLLRKMLELNPEKRITAIDALFVSVNPPCLPIRMHGFATSSSSSSHLWVLRELP